MLFTAVEAELTSSKEKFSPYQLILATLTLVYALRHFDDLLGISGEL